MRLVTCTRLLPAFVAVALALPASAAAQSGGAAAPEPAPAQAASEVALVAAPQALLGQESVLRGTAPRSARGRVLRVQRFDDAAKRWRSEARATVGRNGRFRVRWSPTTLGAQRIRATLQRRRSASVTSASPEVSVRVFKPGMATWYGPGLYGNKTACGQVLTKDLVGVAHKSLPCGTELTLRYHGNTVRVEVIDRGPYVGGREFDLTAATKQRLGFPSTGTVLSSK